MCLCLCSPICLNRPLVAKMTTCGHIFCWPCLLRHISFCEDDPKKKHAYCPICMTYLETDKLKSVELRRSTEVSEGATIEMQLMVKSKACAMGLPYDAWRKQGKAGQVRLPWYNQKNAIFSHFALSSNPQSVLLREEDEILLLREQCATDGCLDLIPFVEGAFELINSKKITQKVCEKPKESKTVAAAAAEKEKGGGEEEVVEVEEEKKGTECAKCVDVCDILSDESLSFYYQIVTGENIFLSPFNMVMLEKEVSTHGTLLPQRISVKVDAMEGCIQSDETRRTHKRFAFLPLTASFTLIEADPSFFRLSKDVYSAFSQKIRAKRAKRESQKRRDKAEKEAFEATPMFPAPPVFSDADFLPLPQGPPSLDECPPLSALSSELDSGQSSSQPAPTPVKSPWGSGSYASIKKSGEKTAKKDAKEEFPELGGSSSSSLNASTSTSMPSLGAWGKKSVSTGGSGNGKGSGGSGANSRIRNAQSENNFKLYLEEERRRKEDMEQRRRDLIVEDELDYDGEDAEEYIPPAFRTSIADSLVLSISSGSANESTNKKKRNRKNKRK